MGSFLNSIFFNCLGTFRNDCAIEEICFIPIIQLVFSLEAKGVEPPAGEREKLGICGYGIRLVKV